MCWMAIFLQFVQLNVGSQTFTIFTPTQNRVMLHRIYKNMIFGLVLILAVSACAVKKLTKQGQQFEAAGMFKEASEMYYNALVKKPQKADLKIAFKRTGQLYLEDISASVKNTFNRGEYKETVYNYLEAIELITKADRAGISLKPDPSMERYYGDAKDFYLEERYSLGLKFITDQDFTEAERVFSEIFKIDPEYKETRTYLNEATFEPIYREGSRLFIEGRFMEAFGKWESIYARERNYKDVKELMDQALSERYNEGTLLLMNEDFDDAALALGDVYRVNPKFKDVKEQYIEARNEPIYRQAKIYFDQGKCRSAYFDYEHIIDDAGVYKDTKVLKDKAFKCAEYPIAVYSPPLERYTTDGAQFEKTLIKNILNRNNLFLKVFDLTSVDNRLEKRLISQSGKIDQQALKNLYQSKGIKALLILGYNDFKKNKGKLLKEKKHGFERIITKDPEGGTNFYDKEITYYEYSQQNEIELKVSYMLIDASSGEIMLSDTYSDSKNDDIKYITYNGDRNSLFPAKGSNNNWFIDESGYKRLQSLLVAETNIESVGNLQAQLFKDLTRKIARDIDNFNPEK